MNTYKIDIFEVDQRKAEIEAKLGLALIVPAQLTDPHPLVIVAKNVLAKKSPQYLSNGLVCTGSNELDIHVSPDNCGRALRFMNAFVRILPAAGYQFRIDHKSNSIVFGDEKIQVKFRERTTRSDEPVRSPGSHQYLPTGILYFKLEYFSWSKEFTNEKLPLEDQLAYILAYIDIKANLIRKERAEWKIKNDENEAQRKIVRDLEERKVKELKDVQLLISRAQRFVTSNQIRDYISSLEQHAITTSSLNDELQQWISWAKRKADWIDPILKADDELLQFVDRDKLLEKVQQPENPFRYG